MNKIYSRKIKQVSIFFFFLIAPIIGNAQSNIFLSQLDGTGNVPSTNTVYTFNTLTAYPSPLLTSEMAPPSPSLRGLDAGFSVVVGGNYTIPASGGSEIEGRLAVKGNLLMSKSGLYGIAQSGGGTFVIGKGDAGAADGYSLYALAVEGNLTIDTGSQISLGSNNNPNPYTVGAGGSIINNGTLTANATATGANYVPVDITGILDEMTILSGNMRDVVQSASIHIGTTNFQPTYSPAKFTGSGTSSTEVFNISAADLALATFVNPIKFANIKSGATIIINVSGTSIQTKYVAQAGRLNDPTFASTSDDDAVNAVIYNIVWNFYEATNITTVVGADINGMILAPIANLTVNSNINGRIYIGGNLVHSGTGSEIHNYPFKGNLSAFESVKKYMRHGKFFKESKEQSMEFGK